MKHLRCISFTVAAVLLLGLFSFTPVTKSNAQRMVQYTWDTYKTKFSVPSTFTVTKSSGDEWQGSDNDMALSIFPKTGEKMTQREMDRALKNWARDEGVGGLGDITDVDSQKLNGYWGVFIEGTKDGWPVCLMLIIDPDYTDTGLYIWISYKEGMVDTVLKILYSFIPS
ncbi:MAG: hypothetical protein HY958_07595 [Bacteroidia bacterium]|nr:hypothetical protein [Bacteroidia bacterium]